MARYFMQMAFDGSAYRGWQIQPEGPTVQGVTTRALSTLASESLILTGAGRTDSGVHASCFVAHFDLKGGTDPTEEQFLFRLNRFLPPDIVVYRIREVPPELHARFSALYRTYQYHISTVKPLFTREYSHYLYGPLDLEEMNRCCKWIVDTTDFTSFSKLHTDVKTNDCRVMHARWTEADTGYLFEIRADRFLRNMVRALVGTLLDVGQGKLDSAGFREVILARDRSRAGQSAPARGLFLSDIGYPVFS